MISRPRPGENEEDILKMQEEFLREREKNKNLKPAAQVVNLRNQSASSSNHKSNDACARKPSKYAQTKNLSGKRKGSDGVNSALGEVIEKNTGNLSKEPTFNSDNDKVYFPHVIPCIVGNVIEKNVDRENNYLMHPRSVPKIFHSSNAGTEKKVTFGKSSIFAQRKQLEKNSPETMDVDEPSAIIKEALNVPEKSYIVTSIDADSIHQQNVELLSKMTESEILNEQKKLVSSLDPKLLQFIKSRRQTMKHNDMDTESSSTSNETNISPDPKTITECVIDDTLWENDILSHPQVKEWVHFDSLEKDKLEWMKGIKESKKQNADEPYEARFDLKGYLLPYTLEYNEKTKTLFHHGEESHRPGYSLAELFELTRSSVTQQRVMSLNVLAGILDYYSSGIYKDVIELPLSKIFFVLRFAMDDNKISILEPSLRALRNLMFNRIDEACLDALLGLEEGLVQPYLEHDKSEISELESKETELKDYHLAEIDLITGSLRTDILQRLHYILNVVKPSYNSVLYSLQILTRIARDSSEAVSNIVNCEHLMNCIINNFLPVTGINFPSGANVVYNGRPMLAAAKLVRVLSLQSFQVAETLVKKYRVMEPLIAYTTSGVDSTRGLKIQMEAMTTLTNFVSYGIETDHIFSLTPVFLTAVYKHVNGTDIHLSSSSISAHHASVLLQLISKIITVNKSREFGQNIYPLIQQGVAKWISQLCSLDLYSCGHLRLLCASLDCARMIINIEQSTLCGSDNVFKTLANSRGFKLLLDQLKSSSNLLSNIDNNLFPSSKNIVTVGSFVIDSKQKVVPVLSFASPIPLLTSLVKILCSLESPVTSDLFADQMLFYLNEIRLNLLSLCDNWFTRVEIDLVFNLLKMFTTKTDINEAEKDIIYAVANKMCCILRSDKSDELGYLFQNIIFNKQWFTIERLLSVISFEESSMFSKILTSIEGIKLVYSKTVNFSLNPSGPFQVLRQWKEPILPRDWIYLPIVKLYSEHLAHEEKLEVKGMYSKKVSAEKEYVVSRCLEWILFNELCFVNLLKDIDLTDRFCRLMCVFLCDNSLFLDKHINLLLGKCMQILFDKEKKCPFDFDKELTGIHNFQDFYTQLLEQFQSVSYGDFNFAACIFVPLAQKHNVKWRKLLWSEYAGCLRALDCPGDKLCYGIEGYLYPEETDESLVKSYATALSSNLVRPNTLSYKIASHHVNCFRNRKSSGQ